MAVGREMCYLNKRYIVSCIQISREKHTSHLFETTVKFNNLFLHIKQQLYFILHAVVQLVEAQRYKSEGRGIVSRIVSLEFYIDIVLPGALGSWG
jgi:predicted GNAT family acetyltransferase